MSVKEVGRPPGRPMPVESKPARAAEAIPAEGPELPEGESADLGVEINFGFGGDDGFRLKKLIPKSAAPLETPGRQLEVPIEQLLPEDFEKVADLAHKFGGDVVLLKRELEGKPGKTPNEKLERLMQFFQGFAEEIVVRREQLYGGEPPPEGPQKEFFAGDVKKFLEVLKGQGLEHAKNAEDGKNGLQVARELLEQPNLKQFSEKMEKVQLQAQTWPLSGGKQELDHLGRPVVTHSEIPIPVTTPLQKASTEEKPNGANAPFDQREGVDRSLTVQKGENLKVNAWAQEAGKVQILAPGQKAIDDVKRRDRTTDKVLGSNMLWNVLHRMREDEDAPEVQEKKALEQVAFGAILLLVAAAIVVVIVVSL